LAKDKEKSLALVRIKDHIKLFETFIPNIFRAPTDGIQCIEAMRNYYGGMSCLRDSFCKTMEDYRKIEEKAGEPEHKPLKPMPKTKALQKFVSGGVLAEYRKKHGLDKLKKKLLEGLVKAASFERGIDILYEHITSPENDIKAEKGVSSEAAHMVVEKEKVVNSKLQDVAFFYPDLTVNEIAWISLTNNKRKTWVLDKPSRMYWPPALIEMNLEGLVFAEGTIDENEFDATAARNPWQIGGITGIDKQTELFYFHPDVSKVIKALVLLTIDDNDLFEKLLKDEDIIPLLRGDELLVRSFRGLDDIPEELLEDIIKSSNRIVRDEIVDFYNKSYFDCPYIQCITDFVRLIGTLERVPKFIKAKKPFRGYVKIYGTDVNFIKESGKIVDSVPIVSHLAHRVAYQFHRRITKLDRKDMILREIFEELTKGIIEENYSQKNQMPTDIVQDQILDLGVFASNQTYTWVEQLSRSTFFGKQFTYPEYLVRTVKFSFDELMDIKRILEDVPEYLRKGVARIIKRTSDYLNIEDVLVNYEEAGSYSSKQKTIKLSLPILTPSAQNSAELEGKVLFYKMTGAKKAEKQKTEMELIDMAMFRIMFCQTIAHEIGESLYASNKRVSKAWDEIEAALPKNIPRKKRPKYFLTAYAATAPNEDFADTFAMYLLFGDQFRELCVHPVIKQKYEFMKKLFSADGREREFKDKFEYSMYTVKNPPDADLRKRLQISLLKQHMAEELVSSQIQGLEADLIARSYDDVEEIIREHEEKGNPITREQAAEILFQRNKEIKEKLERNLEERNFVFHIYKKTMLMSYCDSFEIGEFNRYYSEFERSMVDRDKTSAQKALQKCGVPEKKAKKVVRTMMLYFKNAGEIIEKYMKKKENQIPEWINKQVVSVVQTYISENPQNAEDFKNTLDEYISQTNNKE